MNEIKIKDINNTYEILENAENKGYEITVALLDAIAIIYYSHNLDIFKIDIVNKYELIKPEYHILSNVSFRDLNYYVNVLCNNYRFHYNIDCDDF